MENNNQSDEYRLKQERRRLKRERKKAKKEEKRKKEKTRKIIKRAFRYLLLILVFIIVAYLVSNREKLPGTTTRGHIERYPESRVLSKQMDPRIRAHVLEHADGSGLPGIIINYNCEQFECEPDFIDRLAKFAKDYPDRVYVAPFKNMSSKLVISASGRQDVLDDFDEQRIRNFIER